ncbi:MAG: DegV family protein [Anaerolineae bacterium]|nr:DegV family protein [Anaerolineae bacterium]
MSNMPIALITDSGCDLPDGLLQQYGITLVPLYILWGSEQLRDRVDLSAEAFYRRLVSDPVHPTTSQPHPADFARAIAAAHERGAQEAVIITISSGMSSTYDSAQQAARGAAIPVHVFDARANSLAQGFQVLAAARARQARDTAQAMIAAADCVRQSAVTLLHVDTLHYLHRGGRIGRAAMWLGTVLNLKPQLMVDHETGKIEPASRSRSRTQALERLYTSFFERIDTSKPLHIGIIHSESRADADAFAARIQREHQPVELLISVTSPVMGVHTGPGAIALCGYAGE